jgi:hypothetical protein
MEKIPLICYAIVQGKIIDMENGFTKKQSLVANAMKRVLRPFVKLMLANDLGYTFAIDLLKTLFVEVADNDFMIDGKRQTDSRVSLISGVHRKDVKRLRGNIPDVDEVIPENISLGSQLMAIWNTNAAYLNQDGMPKPLPRLSSEAQGESFEGLVRSITTDIHPRAVLDELIRLGLVSVDTDNYVHLVTDAFIPQEGMEEKAFFFGHNLHDHAEAAVANIQGQQPGYLERCVHYDQLTQASVDQINELAKKQGMKSLQEIFKIADTCAETDKSNQDANMRITYGVYFYHEPMQTKDKDSKSNK